jgi:hypothetical protein
MPYFAARMPHMDFGTSRWQLATYTLPRFRSPGKGHLVSRTGMAEIGVMPHIVEDGLEPYERHMTAWRARTPDYEPLRA